MFQKRCTGKGSPGKAHALVQSIALSASLASPGAFLAGYILSGYKARIDLDAAPERFDRYMRLYRLGNALATLAVWIAAFALAAWLAFGILVICDRRKKSRRSQ